ncbi:Shedu anti-phage system protein SduA domain-containing protein [Phyllobacterium sophorae]|uniref:Shedu protein SduA C-terminal domain-containing protein n=1 Tax=Phyllobacterium sophorae TaxID=1520277 RepID=A0A2P7B6Y8_9HYPH|nr:Shedu anti-phage system protein SduA domain-containing protein [Phyllobacterium sophorae]PSH62233.1 hypothetical protein CU103_20660 [Phyllobacterium sophorae]
MYLEIDQHLIEKFQKVLVTAPPPGRQKEQVVQDFLEQNTELIPTPAGATPALHLDSIISKFKLSTALTSDYVYLNKNSAVWDITLVELESPDKQFFTANQNRPTPTADFTAALAQVKEWRAQLRGKQSMIIDAIKPLMEGALKDNPIRLNYQLIYGRSNDKNRSGGTRAYMLDLLENDGISVLSYDSVINLYSHSQRYKKNVLKQVKHRFGFKHMLDRPRHFFSAMGPQHLHLTNLQIKKLIATGYDMESWKRGTLLGYNDMYPLPTNAEIREQYLQTMRSRLR